MHPVYDLKPPGLQAEQLVSGHGFQTVAECGLERFEFRVTLHQCGETVHVLDHAVAQAGVIRDCGLKRGLDQRASGGRNVIDQHGLAIAPGGQVGQCDLDIAVAVADLAQDRVGGADALGNFVVVWTSDVGSGEKTDILARRVDSTGTLVGTDIAVAQLTDKEQSDPAVSVRAMAVRAMSVRAVALRVAADGTATRPRPR